MWKNLSASLFLLLSSAGFMLILLVLLMTTTGPNGGRGDASLTELDLPQWLTVEVDVHGERIVVLWVKWA